ncbi:MAG: sugar transferase [Clostridia bacterium]|nr:sugar transferase [Clostridia bacterium]
MRLKNWNELPENMKTPEVARYYRILEKKKTALFFKRLFDIVVSAILLVLLSPVFLVLVAAIKLTSKGPVFFRQQRVTTNGRIFRIFKFRTMVADAEKRGAQVTSKNDSRITPVGRVIRKCRLDEIAQLLNILDGSMTFVGTRPEVPKYVARYTPEMMATLLLPAGVTSEASIKYKDEDRLLEGAENVEEAYVNLVLPGKMKYNLESLEKFGFWNDIGIMFKTFAAVAFGSRKQPEPPAQDKQETPQEEKVPVGGRVN